MLPIRLTNTDRRLPPPAFTLIELLLVVAIVSALGVTTSVFYGRFLLKNALDNTADYLQAALSKAHLYALTGRQGTAWGVNYSAPTMTLFSGSSFAARNAALDENFTVNPNISIVGLSQIVFARITGLPSTTPTITLSDTNSNSRTVTINSQGVASQ